MGVVGLNEGVCLDLSVVELDRYLRNCRGEKHPYGERPDDEFADELRNR